MSTELDKLVSRFHTLVGHWVGGWGLKFKNNVHKIKFPNQNFLMDFLFSTLSCKGSVGGGMDLRRLVYKNKSFFLTVEKVKSLATTGEETI